jgi:hypothetical protein
MRKPDRQITESDQPFVHLTNENFSLAGLLCDTAFA